MADQKVGDTIISKLANGQYEVLKVTGANFRVRGEIATLDAARDFAREQLNQGGQVWYRDHRDAADHLEPL